MVSANWHLRRFPIRHGFLSLSTGNWGWVAFSPIKAALGPLSEGRRLQQKAVNKNRVASGVAGAVAPCSLKHIKYTTTNRSVRKKWPMTTPRAAAGAAVSSFSVQESLRGVGIE